MPYHLLDIDLTRALPAVNMTGDENGIAVLVRVAHRPRGWWMEPLPAGTRLSAADLDARITEHTGLDRASIDPGAADDAGPGADRVTIAICTRDRPDRLRRCLASLLAQTSRSGALLRPGGILVIDNASVDDATRALTAEHPDVRYVYERCPGLDFARNRALREAGGELLAFVDDDVVADRHWLAGLLEVRRAHPEAAAYTGLVLPLALETEAQIIFEQRGGFRRGFVRVPYGPARAGDAFYPARAGLFGTGANMVFVRDRLSALGGFDEALDTGPALPGGGDIDAFYRIIRAGERLVYAPDMLVFHEHRQEMAALAGQYERSWGSGFMAFVAKSIDSDPDRRWQLRRFALWWFAHGMWQIARRLFGRHVVPAPMLCRELFGGAIGFFGGYRRSQRRAHRLRNRYPSRGEEQRA